ncbi:hypothetical protein PCE1_004855 [Barthelona sp. PCE]
MDDYSTMRENVLYLETRLRSLNSEYNRVMNQNDRLKCKLRDKNETIDRLKNLTEFFSPPMEQVDAIGNKLKRHGSSVKETHVMIPNTTYRTTETKERLSTTLNYLNRSKEILQRIKKTTKPSFPIKSVPKAERPKKLMKEMKKKISSIKWDEFAKERVEVDYSIPEYRMAKPIKWMAKSLYLLGYLDEELPPPEGVRGGAVSEDINPKTPPTLGRFATRQDVFDKTYRELAASLFGMEQWPSEISSTEQMLNEKKEMIAGSLIKFIEAVTPASGPQDFDLIDTLIYCHFVVSDVSTIFWLLYLRVCFLEGMSKARVVAVLRRWASTKPEDFRGEAAKYVELMFDELRNVGMVSSVQIISEQLYFAEAEEMEGKVRKEKELLQKSHSFRHSTSNIPVTSSVESFVTSGTDRAKSVVLKPSQLGGVQEITTPTETSVGTHTEKTEGIDLTNFFEVEAGLSDDSDFDLLIDPNESVGCVIEQSITFEKPFYIICPAPPLEIAKQLTLIEQGMFKKIDVSEILLYVLKSKQSDQLAPNVTAYVDHFNRMSDWVCSSILLEPEVKQRRRVLSAFIDLAQELLHLKNYTAVFEICGGLSRASVARLTKTFEGLGNRSTILKKTKEAISHSSNFKNLRPKIDELENQDNVQCLPYIGMYLTDLTFINDGNKTYYKSTTGQKLINLKKLKLFMKILRKLHFFQRTKYRYQEHSNLLDALKGDLDILPEVIQRKLSLKYEPRRSRKRK